MDCNVEMDSGNCILEQFCGLWGLRASYRWKKCSCWCLDVMSESNGVIMEASRSQSSSVAIPLDCFFLVLQEQNANPDSFAWLVYGNQSSVA